MEKLFRTTNGVLSHNGACLGTMTDPEYIDLSLYDIYGRLWPGRTTANCYVVNTPGKYRIPCVYGNAIKNGAVNSPAYTNGGGQYQAAFVNYKGVQITDPYIERDTDEEIKSAELTLTDVNNIFTNISVQRRGGIMYLLFDIVSTPVTGANAILSVKDANDDIMWSWHIWVWTDSLETVTITNHTNVNYDILPVNLASTWDDNTKTRIKSWYYQWGRKDPMCPPAAYNSATDATLYGAKTWSATAADTVAEAIKRPYNFFKQYDTTYYNWNPLTYFYNFWDASINATGANDNLATAIKTIYDPCPAGFIIPVGRTFTGFTTTGNNSSTASEFNVIGNYARGWKFKANSSDTTGNFFAASGYRNGETNKIINPGIAGYYHSASSYGKTYVYHLTFYSSFVNLLSGTQRVQAMSVRPIKEYDYQ